MQRQQKTRLDGGPHRPNQQKGDLSRRRFMKSVGKGVVGLGAVTWSRPLLGRHFYGSAFTGRTTPDYRGRVVEVFDEAVLVDNQVQQPVVDQMLERGMRELTGAENLADAWQAFVTPEDVVGLKINTLSGPPCSTHSEVVDAIINGLKLAGVKEENIIIWDRFESHLRRTRYKIQRRPDRIRCYATDSAGVGSDSDVYYEADVFSWIPEELIQPRLKDLAPAYPNSHFSKIFTQHITKQINVPVLKDHNITGITLCLKNLAMGICSNTERFHITPVNCDPMIPEVCGHPMLESKNVLNIADCLSLVYEGSPTVDPQYLMPYHSLMVGTDPVAMDQVGLEILEGIRKEKGLPSIWKTNSQPKHVGTAAKLGVGVGNLDEITHIKV
jgi:hypothetical protein